MPIYPIANLSLLLQPPRSPKRKLEDKALKEKRNQAAGQQLKASSGVLKREKPITTSGRSAKSSSTDKSTISKRASSSKTGVFISNSLTYYWFINTLCKKLLIIFCFPAGGIHPSTSKTKKEATNKTKKEEVSRKVSEEKNKKETAAAAASEAANAAATVVASNAAEIPATDENQENEDGPRKMSAVLSGKMISLFCYKIMYLFLQFYISIHQVSLFNFQTS